MKILDISKKSFNAPYGEPCLICQAWNAQYKRTPKILLDEDIADELERKQNDRRKQLDKEGETQTRQVLKMLNAGK